MKVRFKAQRGYGETGSVWCLEENLPVRLLRLPSPGGEERAAERIYSVLHRVFVRRGRRPRTRDGACRSRLRPEPVGLHNIITAKDMIGSGRDAALSAILSTRTVSPGRASASWDTQRVFGRPDGITQETGGRLKEAFSLGIEQC